MKRLLLSSVVVFSLSGCFMPSGINPSLGCNPITGCQSKDYYLPGRGVWAPTESKFGKKATIGALGGSAVGAYLGARTGDPLIAATLSVAGLVFGHEVGAHFDKVDQMYATMLLRQSLNNNKDGEVSTWSNPNKPVVVDAAPVATNGNCREFVTNVRVGKETRQMRGTACMENNEWVLEELY